MFHCLLPLSISRVGETSVSRQSPATERLEVNCDYEDRVVLQYEGPLHEGMKLMWLAHERWLSDVPPSLIKAPAFVLR
jgi:hypothetical protein